MDPGLMLTTVIVFALMLATVAGFVAARVLMQAAQAETPQSGESPDR